MGDSEEHEQTPSMTPVASLRSKFEAANARPAQISVAASRNSPASSTASPNQDLATLKASAAAKKPPPPPPSSARKPTLFREPRSQASDSAEGSADVATPATIVTPSSFRPPEPVWHLRPSPAGMPVATQTKPPGGRTTETAGRMLPHGTAAVDKRGPDGSQTQSRLGISGEHRHNRDAGAPYVTTAGKPPRSPFESSFDGEADATQDFFSHRPMAASEAHEFENGASSVPEQNGRFPPRLSSHENRFQAHSRSRSSTSRASSVDLNSSKPTLPPRSELGSASGRQSLSIDRRPPATSQPERSALSQGFARVVPASHDHLTGDRTPGSASPVVRTPPPRPSARIPQSYKADARQRERSIDVPRDPRRGEASFDFPREVRQRERSIDLPRTTEPSNASTVLPQSQTANRRPPNFRSGPKMIPTTYESRLFDVSGQHVCTSGTHTRVWDLSTGRLVLTMAHGEQVRANALSFKPTRNIEEEGTKIWIGNNWGEIQEVDVRSKRTTGLNQAAHARRELVKIYRHGAEIWTLDNEGKIIVWPPGDRGSPNLSDYVVNGRVPQGHTTSTVVDGKLWFANARGIHVFQPSRTPSESSFKVTPQSLQVSGAGDPISSAVVDSQPDRIYFGHADGKISIFCRKTYQQLQTCTISLSKICCLVGVGDSLWAGFSNGSITSFNTATQPWVIEKQWQQHSMPVLKIVSDRNSLWKMGKWFVVSLGADNLLGVWDGTLEEDYNETWMRNCERQYCTFEDLSAVVLTWNAGASKPSDFGYSKSDSFFFRDFLKSDELPDIVVFGLQELVDLEDKKLTAKTLFKSRKQDASGQEHLSSVYRTWRDYLGQCLDEFLDEAGGYVELHSASLVGLFSCLFVKSSIRHRVRDLRSFQVKTGMGGLHGNKGAIIVSFILGDTSVCFTNCHLAAGQTSTGQRNNDIASILGQAHLPLGRREDFTSYAFGGDGTMIADHEICIMSGDMNYRIDAMSREAVESAVRDASLTKLLERDQLNISRRRDPAFRLRDFTELPITFNPTYKYDVGTDRYDSSEKRRAPAWCDRIMFRGPGTVSQQHYRRHEVRTSDHRPVTGNFKFRVKAVNSNKREKCRQSCSQRFSEHKAQLAHSAQLDYLVSIFGLTKEQASRQLLN